MTRHEQVRIQYRGVRARVDEGIAPLIRALWRRDIPTVFSCQGGDGVPGEVTFPAYVAEDFPATLLATVTDPHNDPLYRRLNRTDHDYELYRGETECPCCWAWAAWLVPPDFGAGLLVRCRFPADDIPLIVERLEAA